MLIQAVERVIASHDNFDMEKMQYLSIDYKQADKKSIVEEYLQRRMASEAAEARLREKMRQKRKMELEKRVINREEP